MSISEEAMLFLEEHIPDLAAIAVKQAYWQALASGSSVLMCEGENLVEIHPDGTKRIIKKLPPPVPMIKGLRLTIDT
ncbi:MAG: hypothetical protein FJZ63_04030 [Chlamydiae bacterium]|nr:hypothetical protein [Chlamydiota bacterium]